MKTYTEKDVLKEFDKLPIEKQNKILKKALKLALDDQAGSYEYAIARSMNFIYQDDGSYTKK